MNKQYPLLSKFKVTFTLILILGISACSEPVSYDLIFRGDKEEAINRLHATNNFPEFTGRLCPAPCETACVVAINREAVTIKQIELRTIEEAFDMGNVKPMQPDRLTVELPPILQDLIQ